MSPFPATARPKIGLVGVAALLSGLAVAGPLTPPDATAATTPVAATTTTSTVPAARDTIVNKQFPTQSYGSSGVVWLSGNTQGLLAFRTPAVPAGSVATSAKLCLTPTDTARTAIDVFTAPSGWTESATWLTRPATQTTKVGSTSGTLTAGARTCVAVPVSQLEPGETQFRLAANPLVEKVSSRETGSTGPTLSVTYTSSSTTATPTTAPTAPTSAPTTAAPTAAPTTAAPTAAPTTAAPTAAPTTATPPPATEPPLTDTTDFLTTRLSSVQALPMSGSGWTTLLNTANSGLGTVDLSNQDNINAGRVLSAALVYARTGQTAYRDKVVAQLKNVNAGTLGSARVLSVGRQMAGYAMAAALVDYREPSFVSFMSGMRTRTIGNHGRWVNLTQTSEDTANNWGAWAMSSRIALDAYVGDRTDLARAAKVFRGFLGDRSAYAGFVHTGDFDSTWVCGPAASWVPINPASCGDKSGAVVEDISRSGGSYPSVDDTGRTYSWETIGGAMLSAQVLATHGYPDVFSWSDKALLRAAQFEQSHGGYKPLYTINQYIPWSVNQAYGVNLGPISSTAGFGRQYGFTDWLS